MNKFSIRKSIISTFTILIVFAIGILIDLQLLWSPWIHKNNDFLLVFTVFAACRLFLTMLTFNQVLNQNWTHLGSQNPRKSYKKAFKKSVYFWYDISSTFKLNLAPFWEPRGGPTNQFLASRIASAPLLAPKTAPGGAKGLQAPKMEPQASQNGAPGRQKRSPGQPQSPKMEPENDQKASQTSRDR